jgi:diguanylate cyclase (GGDEF)-like protein
MTKILIIEDEPNVRRLIAELLLMEGFEVIPAKNGSVGIECAQTQLPDLILCDVMMPELDGYQVLSQLRKNPLTALIPFIFLTARASKADLRQGMELGADDYLTKPFTANELLGAIAARLAKQQTVAERYTATLNEKTEELNRLAYYDSLTDLPNRLSLREQFTQTVVATAENEFPIAILYLGLDQFRRINTSLGYDHGDLLLQQIAKRLQPLVGEKGVVARLSGDEFAVIPSLQEMDYLCDLDAQIAIAQVTERILMAIAQPFVIGKQTVFISASVGIALYPQDGSDIDSLIRNAEYALRKTKEQGGNGYQFYAALVSIETPDQMGLEADLHYALDNAELEIYYQPQVSLITNQICGAEALLRWQHPDRGMVSPTEFIPLAESTGLIIPIGEWVLMTVCQQIRDWQKLGYTIQVSVNLSARQFSQPNLCEFINRILRLNQINSTLLDLELTESLLVSDVQRAIITLKRLRDMGLRISIDDFGTGYSSLSYLQRFPFDTLKIDRLFIRGIHKNPKQAAITTALTQMAHQLQLQVIAEGVETSEEMTFLKQHGCDAVQGYFFSPAVPANTFIQLCSR